MPQMAALVEEQGKELGKQGVVPKTLGAAPSHITGSTSISASTAATTQVIPKAQKATVPPSANTTKVTNEVPELSHRGKKKEQG
jgi:hypothetical protein